MRITIVNLYYPPDVSPTARLAASLAGHRARLGDEVTVVTSRGRYAEGPPAGRSGGHDDRVTVHRVRAPRRGAVSIASRAAQYLAFHAGAAVRLYRLVQQDVIICLTTPPLIGAVGVLHRCRNSRNPRSKLILWNMDCYPEILEVAGLIRRGGIAARLCRRLNRWLFRRLDHVVCLDDAMREGLRSRYGAGRRGPAFSVVANWEPKARFPDPAHGQPWAGRRELGLGDRFVVLYLGNAGYGHELDVVIDAARTLRGDDVVFLFIGGGVHHRRLGQAAAAEGLDNVLFHPYVPEQELPAALAVGDLGLISLADDAVGVMSPSKLHGYLAAGVPVAYLGPPGSNVDAAIERFACGVRLDHGDAGALVDLVRRSVADGRWHTAMKRRARAAFEEAYCDDTALPKFDEVIEATVSRPCEAAGGVDE